MWSRDQRDCILCLLKCKKVSFLLSLLFENCGCMAGEACYLLVWSSPMYKAAIDCPGIDEVWVGIMYWGGKPPVRNVAPSFNGVEYWPFISHLELNTLDRACWYYELFITTFLYPGCNDVIAMLFIYDWCVQGVNSNVQKHTLKYLLDICFMYVIIKGDRTYNAKYFILVFKWNLSWYGIYMYTSGHDRRCFALRHRQSHLLDWFLNLNQPGCYSKGYKNAFK